MNARPTVVRGLLLCAIIASSAPVRPAEAQSEAPGLGECAPDPATPTDTASLLLLLVPAPLGWDSTEANRAWHAAQAVATVFQAPPQLSLHGWPMAMPDVLQYHPHSLATAWGLSATLDLLVDARGRLLGVTLSDSTNAPELNQALLAAAHRADSLGILDPAPERLSDAVRFTLGVAQQAGPLDSPLMRVRIPYVHPNAPVSIRYQPKPEYPEVARRAGVESAVDLGFVVDEHGHAIPSSITVDRAEYKEFIAAAVHVVLHSDFAPARWGTCPVRQLVHQRISFHLSHHHIPVGP